MYDRFTVSHLTSYYIVLCRTIRYTNLQLEYRIREPLVHTGVLKIRENTWTYMGDQAPERASVKDFPLYVSLFRFLSSSTFHL